jgi:hypothetical protein
MTDYYTTDDTFEAAVFMTLGHELANIDSDTPRIKFSFTRTEQFEIDLEDYFKKKVGVEPFTLKSNIDYLFKIVYKERPKY